jgi:hypothetical protein
LISERMAFWITDILSDNEARAYIRPRRSLEFPFPVAAKTGTAGAPRQLGDRRHGGCDRGRLDRQLIDTPARFVGRDRRGTHLHDVSCRRRARAGPITRGR